MTDDRRLPPCAAESRTPVYGSRRAKWNGRLLAILAAACMGCLSPANAAERAGVTSLDQTAQVLPTPAKLAIWSDKLGYLRWREPIEVYLAMDPAGDRREFREFVYLENIETGQRWYLPHHLDARQMREQIVDTHGRSPQQQGGERISSLGPTRIWRGRVIDPGLWQFVAELRSPDTTEVVKRAHAKFVVSPQIPAMIGEDGRSTEIVTDTTWTNDVIRTVRHQVFVNAGATLRIEPGTLILFRGPQAAIIVERGARIEARGRPDAPIVMTCEEDVGERYAGCWGGLFVLGGAPTTRGTGLAEGIVPHTRPSYGGNDPLDTSGVLEYVRIEFAGGGPTGTGGAGLGLYGVGAGTRIDHVQTHASAGDGIRIVGGIANCTHCVSSGALDDQFAWSHGWRGAVQNVYLHEGPDGGDCGIEGDNDELGFDRLPRSSPRIYNLTLIGSPPSGAAPDAPGRGILLRTGSAVTGRNMLVMGWDTRAMDVLGSSASLFMDGTSSVRHAILRGSARLPRMAQTRGGIDAIVQYLNEDPKLVNVRYEANPDPRPKLGSPALRVGVAIAPPSDGLLDTSAQAIGAFSESNWLEEWTFFGSESDYGAVDSEGAATQSAPPETAADPTVEH